jgi:periplasmic protein CpxP/Spy
MNFPKLSWKRYLLAAGISLAVPLVALAVSQRAVACGFAGGMEGGRMPPYLHALNLSEAQRDKVFDIMHAQAPAMRDKGKAARNAEEALRKLVLSPEYTEPKARELAESAAKATADMALARVKAERQVYDVLTAEQRKTLAEMKQPGEPPMVGWGEGHHGNGPGGMPPPPAR